MGFEIETSLNFTQGLGFVSDVWMASLLIHGCAINLKTVHEGRNE